MYQISRTAAAFTMLLALAACSNPYDPGQRALGGAAIGAGAGAAIGGLAGGWHGAAIGALAGGAVGAHGCGDYTTAPTTRLLFTAARLLTAAILIVTMGQSRSLRTGRSPATTAPG